MQPVSCVNIQGQQYVYADLNISADPEKKWRNAWTVDAGNVVGVDWTLARTQWRTTAQMNRADFYNAAANAGWISNADAVTAASGKWPGSFNDFLSGTEDENRFVQVEFTNPIYHRNHPLIDAMASHPSINKTPEEVDTLFGYDGQ